MGTYLTHAGLTIVTMIRLTNLPVLLVISLYDRQKFDNQPSWWEQIRDFFDHYVGRLSTASTLSAGSFN